jgi:hypothetical protein
MADDSNFQLGRGATKHWLIIAAVFCTLVVLWLGSHNWLLGLGAFSTFFSILLFAGQLLSKRTAEQASFSKWSRTDQVIFCFSLASTVVTSAAYYLALPAMFAC